MSGDSKKSNLRMCEGIMSNFDGLILLHVLLVIGIHKF